MNALFAYAFGIVLRFCTVRALKPEPEPSPRDDILIVKVSHPVGREYYEVRGPRLPPRTFATLTEAEAWATPPTKPTRTVVKRIKRTT